MTLFKTIALTFFMIINLGIVNTVALAEETINSSSTQINETIAHIEKGIVEIKKSDFSAANLHLKVARSSAEKITGNEAIAKQAISSLVQGQIMAKQGEIEKSVATLTKTIALLKTL